MPRILARKWVEKNQSGHEIRTDRVGYNSDAVNMDASIQSWRTFAIVSCFVCGCCTAQLLFLLFVTILPFVWTPKCSQSGKLELISSCELFVSYLFLLSYFLANRGVSTHINVSQKKVGAEGLLMLCGQNLAKIYCNWTDLWANRKQVFFLRHGVEFLYSFRSLSSVLCCIFWL